MKVLPVVGSRPQFIKAAAVRKVLRPAGYTEILTHTGQHCDCQTSRVFSNGSGLPARREA